MSRLCVVVVCVVASACSAVVDPDDMRLPCVRGTDGWDPCPVGLVCEDSYCVRQTCVPVDEICNGEDDDCDGVVDNGHDLDEDGFTWCGGGEMERADCDDSQPAAHPGDADRGIAPVTETCDGLDNDCDGMVDEGDLCTAGKECVERRCVNPNDCTLIGNECLPGEICDTSLPEPRCVDAMGMDCRMGFVCVSPRVCDAATGSCVLPDVQLGMPCTSDGQCGAETYCALAGAVGQGTGRICTKACCTHADCPAGTICYAHGTGAKMCMPTSVVGANSDPACGRDGDCGSGNSCAFGDGAHYCSAGDSGGGPGDSCFEGCRSGVCFLSLAECSGACRTTADCPANWICKAVSVDTGDRAQMCIPYSSGAGVAGSACRSDTDCRDLLCLREQCWDTCCNDSDCTGGGRCRAVEYGSNHYEMHCEPG